MMETLSYIFILREMCKIILEEILKGIQKVSIFTSR